MVAANFRRTRNPNRLAWSEGWRPPGRRRSVYVHQMNWVNSRNDFGHDDSTINFVMAITIIIRSTQPCIPPGSLNRVPASAGVWAGMSPLPGGR